MLGRLGRAERRDVSYQDVWGRGDHWPAPEARASKDSLALSAVIACVNLRANTLAQLPLKAYRTGADGLPVEVPRQPGLVENPSTLPRSQWLRQMSISRDLYGNAFGMIAGRDAAGWPTTVEWLDPTKVQTRQDYHGGPVLYTYRGEPVRTEDVFLVPGFPVPGSPLGISPLERSGLIELSHRAQDFGRDWLKNSAVPAAILYADAELDADDAERIRASVQSSWRKRRPAVLGSGLRYEKVGVDADESQFLETMAHAGREVARIYGVDPAWIGLGGSGSSLTYQNLSDRLTSFMASTMNAELVLIQEVMTAQIPRPQFVRFTTGAFLRSDLPTRFAAYSTGIAAGFLSVDEVRELEDRGPLPTPQDAPGGAPVA